MPTSTLADVELSNDWEDLVATHASLALAIAEIQNVGSGVVAVVSGGAGAPIGKSGTVLGPRDRVTVTAANVWARSLETAGAVSVTLL